MIINLLFQAIFKLYLLIYNSFSSLLEGLNWTQPDLSPIYNLYGYLQYFFNSGTITLVVILIVASVPVVLTFAVIRFIYQKIPGVQ